MPSLSTLSSVKIIPSIVFVIGITSQAAIAQLGERQTEDLKVPSSILGLGIAIVSED